MSVVNGQIANQTTFNNAFMSRLSATTQTVAQVQLENAAPESGAFVGNVQRAINKAYEGLGTTGEADTTINEYANENYISNGDNRKVAVEKLDAQLKNTQDDLDAAELVIDNHETRLDSAEATIIDHENRIDAAETTINDHETRLDSAEATIIDHETRLDSAEATIIDHENRIDAAETTINDHETRLDTIETANSTFSGNKTFNNDVVVVGNLEVQGTTTSINSTDLEVEDQNILVNKNGTDGSSINAGIDVERPSGNAGIRFDNSLASKWKVGLVSAMYEVLVSGIAQTVQGIKDFVSGITTDTINESTLNSGVTVDGVLIKDGLVDNRDVSADGTTLDGHTTTLSSHTSTLADHETRIDAAEATIIDHETRIDSAESTITSHTSTLADHETRLDSAESTITDHENRIDTLETNDIAQDSRLDDLESNNMTIAGNKTFSGNSVFQGNTTIESNLLVGAVVNTQTGSDQQLTGITAPLIKLTGVGLVSVNRIEVPAKEKIIAIINQTGADVTFLENVGLPVTERIRTGLNADVVLKDNAIAFFAYDTNSGLWYISSVATSAGGGGGGSTGKKIFDMKLNGLYGGSAAYNGVDGLWVAPSNCQITNVYMYQDTAGSGGTTTLDLKVKPFLSGSFTSIFLTTPKMTNLAGANAWGGVGDTVTGFTAPVLTSLPFAVAAKSAIRMDLIGAQTGSAAGVGLIIEYEEI